MQRSRSLEGESARAHKWHCVPLDSSNSSCSHTSVTPPMSREPRGAKRSMKIIACTDLEFVQLAVKRNRSPVRMTLSPIPAPSLVVKAAPKCSHRSASAMTAQQWTWLSATAYAAVRLVCKTMFRALAAGRRVPPRFPPRAHRRRRRYPPRAHRRPGRHGGQVYRVQLRSGRAHPDIQPAILRA